MGTLPHGGESDDVGEASPILPMGGARRHPRGARVRASDGAAAPSRGLLVPCGIWLGIIARGASCAMRADPRAGGQIARHWLPLLSAWPGDPTGEKSMKNLSFVLFSSSARGTQ